MAQSINEQIGTLTAIEAELHFREIGRKMFGADLMPASHNATLQKRKCVLNRVRVDVRSESDIFFRGVIDGLMLVFPYGFPVCREFIGYDHVNIGRNIFLNVSLQGSRFGIFGMEETNITAALPYADNNFLLSVSSPVLTALSAADIGFVHLDSTVQHWPFSFVHRGTDAMTEIPSCLVAHSDCPLELHGAYPFARFHQQQNCEKPFCERQMRVMEDRAAGNCELIFASNTLKAPVFFQCRDAGIMATWALNTVRPAQPLQEFAATFIGRIEHIYFRESHGK